jgi:hypothetical protein
MMQHRSKLLFSFALLTMATVQAAAAAAPPQGCTPDWMPAFGGSPGVSPIDPGIERMFVLDDGEGSGTLLHVGDAIQSAGGVAARGSARWNGSEWSSHSYLPLFMDSVKAGVMFDSGTGLTPHLLGRRATAPLVFNNCLARRNGAGWEVIDLTQPSGPIITDMVVYDPPGPQPADLYLSVSDFPGVLRFNGGSLVVPGTGVTCALFSGIVVRDLEVFDSGSGSELYACGSICGVGVGVPAQGLVKWNGSTWQAVGIGQISYPKKLAAFRNGTVPKLFATTGNALFECDGVNAVLSAAQPNAEILGLDVVTYGGVEQLIATGEFGLMGSTVADAVAAWDGSNWSGFGNGSQPTSFVPARCAASYVDASGVEKLYVGGSFANIGSVPANGFAAWDGQQWRPTDEGLNNTVRAITSFDDGNGAAIYVGGNFTKVGALSVSRVARHVNGQWQALGSGMNGTVLELLGHDDGSGPVLYAGGAFTQADGVTVNRLARWDGQAWTAMGPGFDSLVNCLAVFDSGFGPQLHVGGNFTSSGGVAMNRLARWDGSAWQPLGGGVDDEVLDLHIHDDGSGGGPALYVTGEFLNAGGMPMPRIARWNGSNFTPVGSGLQANGNSMVTFDDGTGPALYVGGASRILGGTSLQSLGERVARWNGSSWSAVGDDFGGVVRVLGVYDEGPGLGQQLLAGGRIGFYYFHRWNGADWTAAYQFQPQAEVWALGEHDAGTAGDVLLVGGAFSGSPAGDAYIAQLGGCSGCSTPQSYCTPSTSTNGCVSTLSAVGSASVSASSGFTLQCSGTEGQRNGVFFYGVNGPKASSWASASTSVLCVKGPVQRMPVLQSGGVDGQCDGVLSVDWLQHLSTHPQALGLPFSVGDGVWAQAWFRDSAAPAATNLSDGLRWTMCP